jgi:nucleolar complex protein 2
MAKGGISKRKQTRNFLKSGQLESQLASRQKRKTFQQKLKSRDARRNKGVLPDHQKIIDKGELDEEEFQQVKRKKREQEEDESDDDDEELDVDGLLGAQGLQDDSEGEQGQDVSKSPSLSRTIESILRFPIFFFGGKTQDDASDFEDDDLSGLDDEDEEVDPTRHIADLKALAEKDPEFFKYLQENDAELLNFEGNTNVEDDVDMSNDDDDDDDEDEQDNSDDDDASSSKKGKGKAKESKKEKQKQTKKKDQVLTKELLKTWQKNILEVRETRFQTNL